MRIWDEGRPMAAVQLVSWFDGPPDAPVLILGNPIGTNRDVWAHQLPVLSRYFRVLRYEARGHGRPGPQSPAPPGPYTIADLGGDVLALADAHGIERFAYAGVSLGGMTGIWLAATAPGRITSLAACSPARPPPCRPGPTCWPGPSRGATPAAARPSRGSTCARCCRRCRRRRSSC